MENLKMIWNEFEISTEIDRIVVYVIVCFGGVWMSALLGGTIQGQKWPRFGAFELFSSLTWN